MANCAYHPERDTVGACISCGKLVCEECKKTIGGKIHCHPCSLSVLSVVENTSGQGSSAVVPNEIKGWNWGAFLLNWIWGIGNNVWIALLAFIPYLGIIMVIILGAKGNEWAWQKKRWDSVEHFKRTQSQWTKWGVILFIAPFAIMFLFVICIPNI